MDLPSEIWQIILLNLPVENTLKTLSLNKRLALILDSEYLWYKLCLRDIENFGGSFDDRNYKKNYFIWYFGSGFIIQINRKVTPTNRNIFSITRISDECTKIKPDNYYADSNGKRYIWLHIEVKQPSPENLSIGFTESEPLDSSNNISIGMSSLFPNIQVENNETSALFYSGIYRVSEMKYRSFNTLDELIAEKMEMLELVANVKYSESVIPNIIFAIFDCISEKVVYNSLTAAEKATIKKNDPIINDIIKSEREHFMSIIFPEILFWICNSNAKYDTLEHANGTLFKLCLNRINLNNITAIQKAVRAIRNRGLKFWRIFVSRVELNTQNCLIILANICNIGAILIAVWFVKLLRKKDLVHGEISEFLNSAACGYICRRALNL